MEKKHGALITFLIVLIVLVGIGGYFAGGMMCYGTKDGDGEIKDDGNNVDNNQVVDNNGSVNNNNQDVDSVNKTNLFSGMGDGDQLTVLVNGVSYDVKLTNDKLLTVKSGNDEHNINVNNVKLAKVTYREIGPEQTLLILTNDGVVYSYEISSFSNQKYDAVKEMTDIKYLAEFKNIPDRVGGTCTGILGVTNKGEYKEIIRLCV